MVSASLGSSIECIGLTVVTTGHEGQGFIHDFSTWRGNPSVIILEDLMSPPAVVLGFSQSELVHSLVVLLSTYCTHLGHTFTHTVVSKELCNSM